MSTCSHFQDAQVTLCPKVILVWNVVVVVFFIIQNEVETAWNWLLYILQSLSLMSSLSIKDPAPIRHEFYNCMAAFRFRGPKCKNETGSVWRR